MLVEVLPKEEIKSAGGIIVGSAGNDHKSKTDMLRPKLAIVLAVGPGYVNEESGDDVPLDVEPGAVILVSETSLRYYSHFPGLPEFTGEMLALALDGDVHIAWPSIEAYTAYQTSLNV